MGRVSTCLLACAALPVLGAIWAHAGEPPAGERRALPPDRITQAEIASGAVRLQDLRMLGMRIFSTPFNRHDGYGDGPSDPADPTALGGRPTLQGNGTFLRINGLDAQTCLECHSFVRASTVPPTLGLGGFGGSNSNAIIMPSEIDPQDVDRDGAAGLNGRFANPPFVFGVGGVELLGLEMTADLQALKARALANPGTDVELETKGVYFGSIRADAAGTIDWTNLEGVDRDLVVKPLGRKGEFTTVRDFDLGAMQFHFGMQPIEVVGEGVDADGDGCVDEILPGDLSALHAFAVTFEHPYQERLDRAAQRGGELFRTVGCAGCHMPSLETTRRRLPLRFPEIPTRPFENAYLEVDLSKSHYAFERTRAGGLRIPLFSDLKRHDMGDRLKESFRLATEQQNREFVTARLWGIADSGPWLHDGRATTLTEAILFHGGEAEPVRERFAALSDEERGDLLAFLRTLRTPDQPGQDLHERAAREEAAQGKPGKGGGKKPKKKSASWFRKLLEKLFR